MSLKNFIENTLPSLHIKAESLAPQSSYIANSAGFAWGAVTFNQWVMAITLLLGIATFAVNFYFQCKRNAREKAKAAREAELHREQLHRFYPENSDS